MLQLENSAATFEVGVVDQLIEAGLPLIVVLNLMDEAEEAGIIIDLEGLSKRLGVSVVGTVATSGRGMDKLRKEITNYVQ